MVCKDWPFCTNNTPFSFADYSLEQWIQMGHRVAAGLLFVWTILFFVEVMKHYRGNRVTCGGWITTLSLIVLQGFFRAMILCSMFNLCTLLVHGLRTSWF